MPGRQYIAKANQVQPSRLIKDVEFLSEGILSFVEHAPRLLIVQPSRLLPKRHSKRDVRAQNSKSHLRNYHTNSANYHTNYKE